jgi:UPF0271 protein
MQTDVWNILDTCAFFTQMHPNGKIATVTNIKDEIINRQSKQYYSNLKSKGLKIIEPVTESVDFIKEKAKETGDLDVLSLADIKILALGYELQGTVVSDDFAIQNVSLHIGLEIIACSGKKITELRKWKYRCSACKLITDVKNDNCSVCGSHDIFRIKSK